MDEDGRMQVALFRYGVISDLVQERLSRGEQARFLNSLSGRWWQDPRGRMVRVSPSTVKTWLYRFRKGGFEALKPRRRRDRGQPRAISPEIIDRLADLKRQLPARSVSQLIRILEVDPHSGIEPGTLKRSTVHRHLSSLGLTRRQVEPRKAHRRFERRAPGDLWQLDQTSGLLLPHPHRVGKWMKTDLFAAVDDHSRACVHCQFYSDAKMPRLEHFTRHALSKAGVPRAIYVDRAGIHVSSHFRGNLAVLGVKVILGRSGHPAGRGKMERFMGTMKSEFYPEARLLIASGEITNLEQLNQYLWAWVEQDYQGRVHSETGETPRDRYQKQSPPLPDPAALVNLFLSRVKRKVRKDATVSLHGNRYQVDDALVGNFVELRYDPFDLRRVDVWLEGRFLQVAKPHVVTVHATPSRIEPPREEKLTVSYLKLLKARHDQELAREMERLRFRDLPEQPLRTGGGLAPFLLLLEQGLGRDLSPTETGDTGAYWDTYGPFDLALAEKILRDECIRSGTDHHLIVYLEAIKSNMKG